MDLSPIGKHCALQSCNALDSLPFQCGCLEWFCKLHISPDLHNCPSVQRQSSRSSSSTPVRAHCTLPGCSEPCLVTASTAAGLSGEGESCGAVLWRCAGCQLPFCVHHRHAQSHSCTDLATGKDDTKHSVARAILTQHFLAPGTPASASHTPVAVRQRRNLAPDPKKLAQIQRVNLMKLRHKAIPGDPKDGNSMVPVDERLHALVRLDIVGQSAKESILWFRKTAITGKVLDLIVQHFGISHTHSTLYLKRSSTETGGQILQNHEELSGQLEDGSTVVLTESPPNGPSQLSA